MLASRLRSTLSLWQYPHWILIFLLVPVLNLAIPLLPEAMIRAHFILDPGSPAIASMFLANYTHTTIAHLSSNLALYLLTVTAIFSLEQRTRFFAWISLGYLLVLPLWLSAITLLFLRSLRITPAVEGFSGIAFAFLGYLVYLGLYRKVYRKFVDQLLTRWWHHTSPGRVQLLAGLLIMDAFLLALLFWIFTAAGKFSPVPSGLSNGLTHGAGLSLGILIPLSVELRKRGLSSSNLAFLGIVLGTITLYALSIARSLGMV